MADRSPDDIEREIEAERGALARSLDALQNQFSPETMIDNASGYMREHGAVWAESAARQARDNPLALALTGVGLAWLIAGPARKRSAAGTYDRWAFTHDETSFAENYGETRHDEVRMGTASAPSLASGRVRSSAPRPQPRVGYDQRSYEPAAGFRSSDDPMTGSMSGFDDRLARASGDSRAAGDYGSRASQDPSLSDRISDGAHDAADWVRNAFDSISDRFGSTAPVWTRSADWTSPADTAEQRSSLSQRLMEGTERMTDTARDRVMAAREAALDAQHYVSARTRDYAASGREYYGEQPLIGGLLAFGIGAILGAVLPRTRQEDAYLGSYRDRALEEAERIYHEETGKLRDVADAALDEAKAVANEKMDQVKSGTPSGNDVARKAEGEVKNAADRIADAAKSEAQKRDLGGSVS